MDGETLISGGINPLVLAFNHNLIVFYRRSIKEWINITDCLQREGHRLNKLVQERQVPLKGKLKRKWKMQFERKFRHGIVKIVKSGEFSLRR